MSCQVKIITVFMLTFLALSSCTPELEDYEGNVEGPSYFPLAVGNTWLYRLDSVIYDNKGTRVDTVSLWLRETITEKYTDVAGDVVYRIERSGRDYDGGGWEISGVWSASVNDRLAYKTENNLKFLKLSFPIVANKSWEGNIFFPGDIVIRVAGEPIKMYQNWGKYKYTAVDETFNSEEGQFENVCTVLQADLENKISKRYSLEKYAKNIGLIYKEMWILDTQKSESAAPWELKAEEGFILRQQLVSFTPGPPE